MDGGSDNEEEEQKMVPAKVCTLPLCFLCESEIRSLVCLCLFVTDVSTYHKAVYHRMTIHVYAIEYMPSH